MSVKQPPSTPMRPDELGPFAPPAGFRHPPEFDTTPPRPFPPSVLSSRYMRSRRMAPLICAVLGSTCLLLWLLPVTTTLSDYVLPLRYLQYIGMALLGLGAFVWVVIGCDFGELSYIRRGLPIIGRVLWVRPITERAMVPLPHGNRLQTFSRIDAEIEFIDPHSQSRETVIVTTGSLGAEIERFNPGIAAGDYVTLVKRPVSYDRNPKLYGWSGLSTTCDLLLKDGKRRPGLSTSAAILLTLGISAIPVVLLGGLHVAQFCWPIEQSWNVATPIAAATFAAGYLATRRWIRLSADRSNLDEKILAIGGGLASLAVCFVTLFVVNAAFDRSSPRYVPVEIVNYWQTTQNYIFRDYSVEYRTLGGNVTHQQPASVAQMEALMESDLGVIDIAAGRLGMKWVRGIYPLTWSVYEDEYMVPVGHETICFEFHDSDGVRQFRFVSPAVQLPEQTLTDLPDALREAAFQRLTREAEKEDLVPCAME